jgi:hypothetical protein
MNAITFAPFALTFFLSGAPRLEPPTAPVNSHLWVVNELFSSADGTVQFIEMRECCGSTFENSLANKKIFSDATGHQYTFPANVPGNTAHRSLLLATASFAVLPGAPTPDFVIPENFFSTTADTIRWHIYPDATLSFTAGQLPLDGLRSFNRGTGTQINSPQNYAGQSGSVNVAAPVPGMPVGWVVALVAVVGLAGLAMLLPRAPRA